MTLTKLVKTIVAALEEIKARDVEVLDVTKITALFDRMIIASGDSTRQTKAIANNVAESVKAAGGQGLRHGRRTKRRMDTGRLRQVLVHVMQVAVRAHYNLEELWAEGIKVNKASASSAKSKTLAETPAVKRRAAPAKAKAVSPVEKNKAAKAKFEFL